MAAEWTRDNLQTVVDQARERVRDRARQAFRRQVSGLVSPARGAAPARSAQVSALPLPEPGKDRPVSIRLASGRRVNAVLSPGVARRSDLAAIARATANNNRRAFGVLQAQRVALDELKRSQTQLAEKVSQLEKRADDAVLALTQTVTQSSYQLKQLAAEGQKLLTKAGTAATTAVQTLAVTQQAQNLTNVIGTAQATAYGERGSVLAPNNLLLTGNQLLWTFLAPMSVALGASVNTARVLALLAPVGSLLTGLAVVGSRVPDRKHERFISDIAVFDLGQVDYTESLRGRMSDELFEKFRARTNVAVTVNSIDPIAPDQASAEVRDGVLHINVVSFGAPATVTGIRGKSLRYRIAWMVDTGEANG
jgi:hypothetical protein